MKNKKIIKSFKQLGEINRRELFIEKKFIENGRIVKEYALAPMDHKRAVSIARQLADGFDYDLRKPVPKNAYYRARKIIEQFYEGERARSVLIRPKKSNRKHYAKLADVSDKFKVYQVPVSGDNTEFEFQDGKIIERGQYIDYIRYFFPDQAAFAKNQKKEIRKLLAKIQHEEKSDLDNFKKDKKQLRIQTGKYHTHASYDPEIIEEIVADWNNQYGIERVNAFVRGFVVAQFHDQKKTKPRTAKRKRKK